jgi:hypothetical protein
MERQIPTYRMGVPGHVQNPTSPKSTSTGILYSEEKIKCLLGQNLAAQLEISDFMTVLQKYLFIFTQVPKYVIHATSLAAPRSTTGS